MKVVALWFKLVPVVVITCVSLNFYSYLDG